MAWLLCPAGLLKQAVIETQHTKVLIDGFPRVLDQLKEFEHLVGCQHNLCLA
jgi:adenylate kinase family enzyme